MNNWYVVATTVLFTLFALVSMLPPIRPSAAVSVGIHAVFATWGWVNVARLFW